MVDEEDRVNIDRSSEARSVNSGETGTPTGSPESAVETPRPHEETPAEGGKIADGVSPSPTESSPQPTSTSGYWPKSAVDRVAKLTARLREYEAKGVGAAKPIDPMTGKQFTVEQIDNMINERAMLVANQTAFNTRCNDVAGRGASRFPDWQMRLGGLTQLVDQTDPRSVQNYNLFLEAVLETGDAEGIIHRLGSDLNEAARVLAMPPVKMAMEVGKLGEGKRSDPSKAPKPIRPLGSNSPVSLLKPDDPDRGGEMSIDDWMKARNKQATERRIR